MEKYTINTYLFTIADMIGFVVCAVVGFRLIGDDGGELDIDGPLGITVYDGIPIHVAVATAFDVGNGYGSDDTVGFPDGSEVVEAI